MAANVEKVSSTDSPTSQDHRESSLLNECDVNKILERKFGNDNFRLVDWKLVPLEEAKGFLGQYYHLRVSALVDDKMQSLQFFAKSPPPNLSPQVEFVQYNDLFNKEIVIYTDLMRQMGAGESSKWTVECYFSKRNTIIVLEDASLDGYVILDKYLSYDVEHCIWVLRTISKLHSRSLILDEKFRRESGRTIYDLYGHLLNDVLLINNYDRSKKFIASSIVGVSALVDLFEELNDEEKMTVKRRITEWSKECSLLLVPSKKYRNVVCHRDVWSNNLMFQYDLAGNVNNCYMIDFQFFGYSPPAIDVALFLYLTTDKNTRDRYFDFLIKTYHESFARNLAEEGFDVETYLPWTTFRQSCKEARNIALFYAAFTLQVMLLSKKTSKEYFYNSTEKLEQVLYGDERAEIVRYQCEKEPSYKLRMFEILCEVKDRMPEYPQKM